MTKNTSNFLVSIVVALLCIAPAVFAAGPPGIRYTIHNMSNTNTNNFFYRAASDASGREGEDEICIFCHTPHGGTLTGPLWNRPTSVDGTAGSGGDNPVDYKSGTYFTHYNSATLTAAARGNNRLVNDESLLCMTCHDGTIAVNRVLNVSNRTSPDTSYPLNRIENTFGNWAPINANIFEGIPGKNIGSSIAKVAASDFSGGDLSDDHPISFSYTAAQNSDSGLRSIDAAILAGVRFFGGDRVECSSCHDPHVDYGDPLIAGPNAGDPAYTKYNPFLIMSNEASALCRACHIK